MQTQSIIRWHRFGNEATMNTMVVEKITALAQQSIAQKKLFSIVLAGGNTPRSVYLQLKHINTDWSRWHIYFGDERCLPANSEGRNDHMADEAWLAHVAIPAAHIHRIPSELPSQQAVAQYTEALKNISVFDLVLLGIGEDGHTASLFPHHFWGEQENNPAVLAVTDAPFPPSQRISLSAQRLSCTQHLWYLVSGSKKTNALQRWQQGEHLPMAVITPPNGVDVFVSA